MAGLEFSSSPWRHGDLLLIGTVCNALHRLALSFSLIVEILLKPKECTTARAKEGALYAVLISSDTS